MFAPQLRGWGRQLPLLPPLLGNVGDSYPEAIVLCFLLHEVDGVPQLIGARGSRAEPLDEVLQAVVGGVLVPL